MFFFFCLVFAMSLFASVYMCFVVTCWEKADLLALVCGVYLSLSLSYWYPILVGIIYEKMYENISSCWIFHILEIVLFI